MVASDWRNLVLSPEITGINPPESLDAFTDMVVRLRERLNEEDPIRASTQTLPKDLSVPARLGCSDVDWFGHGWQIGNNLELALPPMKPTRFAGTSVTLESSAFNQSAVFVEYRFRLTRQTRARVMFNTHENCRVFLNGQYVFGREIGRMAPSPHRIPNNQSTDAVLPAGEHTLVAVLRKPECARKMEWVVGVSDCDNNDQWIPNAWA